MIVYSHASEDEEKGKIGTKELKNHLEQVYKIASGQLYDNLGFSIENRTISDILKELCMFHDIGKYTSFFQDYLLNRKKVDADLKKHSQIGAYCIANKYLDIDFNLALLGYFCLVNHHGNLTNIKDTEFFYGTAKPNYEKRFAKQKEDLIKKKGQIQDELKITSFEKILKFTDYPYFRKSIRKKLKHDSNVQDYYFTNYLFSLLTEADKLDASETPLYTKQPLDDTSVDKIIKPVKLSEFSDINKINEQNKLRSYAKAKVISQLEDPKILDYKLFTLTAPTGIGKTLTSLDFALKLKSKIRTKETREAKIIYGLPFINIIEQALDVYKNQVFKNDEKNNKANILAHYQYADVFGNTKYESTGYQQKLMQLDTWQADIVITSFVQLFETLISNRNKLLKKFNHLAGSIIILDEVQTLKLDLMPLIGAALYFLSKFLDARIIMMTATQPKIFELAQKLILDDEGEKAQTKELLTNHHSLFRKFERTKIVPLLDKKIDNDDFIEIFNNYWKQDKSCLIVCNTVQRSLEIFNQISELELENPIYYLSTNIIPIQRKSTIDAIRNDLKENKKPILVTTQVVEAGVDLDFDMGFRDIGPIDSIVQVVGRINRENDDFRKHSPLYVINFVDQKEQSDAAKVYGDLTFHQAKNALTSFEEVHEKDYKTLVENYFENLSEKKAFEQSAKLFNSMKTLKYDGEKEEYPISSFRIIDQAPWVISVFIESNEEAKEAREAYEALLEHKLGKEDFDKKYKLIFHQHIIGVPDYLPKLQEIKADENNYLTENILLVRKELIGDFYNEITGFNRTKEELPEKIDML